MISSAARQCILIWLFLRLFVPTVSFNDASRFDEGLLGFEGEEDIMAPWFPSFDEKRSADQRDLNVTLKNSVKMFKNKANTLSRLFKIHIDRLKNQIDEVIIILRFLTQGYQFLRYLF